MSISAPLLAGFFTAIAAPWLHGVSPSRARVVFVAVPLAVTAHVALLGARAVSGEPITAHHTWAPSLGLAASFRLDGLSLVFASLVLGVGTLVVVYSGAYLDRHPHLGRFYGLLLLFMFSMAGLVLTDNVLALYGFWELTTISSYLLIGFEHEDAEARSAALRALLVTTVGGLALLAGVLLLGDAGQSFRISELVTRADVVRDHAHYPAIVVLVFLAAFTKSAQFPFHFWLPSAMTAPTPVSAYLHAAAMVKAGIYLLARLSPVLSGPSIWHAGLTWFGGATMLVGATMALGQRDLKRILAYSTVGGLGLLVLLNGVGTRAALETMLVFLVAHALYKGALFLVAGGVDHAVHQRDAERISGLLRAMPWTAAAAILAALSMGGVPPLLGYVSKEMLYESTLHAESHTSLLTAVSFVTNALFFGIALLVGLRPFLSRRSPGATAESQQPERPSWPLFVAPLVLAGASAVLGAFPSLLEPAFGSALAWMRGTDAAVDLKLWHGLNLPLLLSVLTLLAGALLYAGRWHLRALAARVPWLSRAGPARLYEAAFAGVNRLATLQTKLLQNGWLRLYTLVVLVSTTLLAGRVVVTFLGDTALGLAGEAVSYESVLALLCAVSAVAAVRVRSAYAAILAAGVVGYSVALIFVLFAGPDLGITQIAVETFSVIVLALALRRLPDRCSERRFPSTFGRVVIAIGFGGLMSSLVVVAGAMEPAHEISDYYAEVAVPEAHGRNVVNVILTDFRALDTLGEIVVLATAALGVFALLKFRTGGQRA